MFTYNNIMRALKAAGGIPDYWYAQFVVSSLATVGLAQTNVVISSETDITYPVQQNGPNIKVWYDSIGGNIYSQSGFVYTYNDSLVTQNGADYWYTFNGNILPSAGGATLTNNGGVSVLSESVSFNNSANQYLTTSSGIADSASWSLFGVVSLRQTIQSDNIYAIVIGNGSQSNMMFGLLKPVANNVRGFVWTIGNPAGGGSGTISLTSVGKYTFVDDERFSFCISINRDTSYVEFYINGVKLVGDYTYNISSGKYIIKDPSSIYIRVGMLPSLGVQKSIKGDVYDLKVFNTMLSDSEVLSIHSESFTASPAPIITEYTGVAGNLKPVAYNPSDVTIDTTSIIADHPDANDWQPYGT